MKFNYRKPRITCNILDFLVSSIQTEEIGGKNWRKRETKEREGGHEDHETYSKSGGKKCSCIWFNKDFTLFQVPTGDLENTVETASINIAKADGLPLVLVLTLFCPPSPSATFPLDKAWGQKMAKQRKRNQAVEKVNPLNLSMYTSKKVEVLKGWSYILFFSYACMAWNLEHVQRFGVERGLIH